MLLANDSPEAEDDLTSAVQQDFLDDGKLAVLLASHVPPLSPGHAASVREELNF